MLNYTTSDARRDHMARMEAKMFAPGAFVMLHHESKVAGMPHEDAGRIGRIVSRDGHTRYAYDVRPDTAGFVAAAELARDAMEQAIQQRAVATFQPGAVPYTKKQLKALEKARKDLAEAGVVLPQWWQHATSRELTEAAIEAVRGWQP